MEEDVELDSKYRSYANQVEKVLKQFESPREWADLCSYLTKLKRVSNFQLSKHKSSLELLSRVCHAFPPWKSQ